jgi:hypothetical protein
MEVAYFLKSVTVHHFGTLHFLLLFSLLLPEVRTPAMLLIIINDGTNFANKRRPLGRYSSLADYKPRSLVFFFFSLGS